MDFLYLHQRLSKTRLDQRATRLDSGDVLFDAPDGKGPVRFTAERWEAVRGWHAAQIAPAGQFFKWSMWLNAPIALGLLIALMMFMPGWSAFARWVDRTLPPQIVLGLLLTWPAITGLIVNARATFRANDALNRMIAGMPRDMTAAIPKRRLTHGLELLAAALVGPHLVLGLYGTLNPGAYLNTPLSGTRLGWIDGVGLGVLLALVILRRRRTKAVEESGAIAATSFPVPAARTFGRRRA